MENLREGYFVETREGLIFHVKGVYHPDDGVIGFLRYVPSDSGDRVKNGRVFEKIYSIGEKFEYLEKNFPKYVQYSENLEKKIQIISFEDIEKVYKPQEKLQDLGEKRNLSKVGKNVVEFTNKLIETGIKPENLGITGSILVGLHKENSDIDLIGYGKKPGWKIYSALKDLKEEDSEIKSYDEKNALKIAKFRWGKTGIPLEIFASIEKEKVLHGMFKNRDFFIRLVKHPSEIKGNFEDFSYIPQGKEKITGTIKETKDSIFTPNHYPLKNTSKTNGEKIKIKKITSYRGRFTEQAKVNEKIAAYGRLEKVKYENKTYHRLLLGQPDEYLLPLNDRVKKELDIV